MVIVRLAPGDAAPWTGTYALVGHYGEPTSYSVKRKAGERLPVVELMADIEPVWFVLMDEANQQAGAA
jgi:hypothetical protein